MRTLPVARALALLALVAVVASGCAKKVTSVDSAYTQVEGKPDPRVLLVSWPDLPNTTLDYARQEVPGSSPVEFRDVAITTTPIYNVGPGAQRLAIFDGSISSAFQMFRRERSGGFRQFKTYPLPPTRRWIDTQYEYYGTTDGSASGFTPATYVARGLVEGLATPQSPLSNVSVSTATPAPSLVYRGSTSPTDSLFRMSWNSVSGAAGYWLHVYQFRANASVLERQKSGAPAPILDGNVQDFFVGYVAAPETTFKLPSDTTRIQPGQIWLARRGMLNGQVYLVRVTAVDAAGQVVAWMKGDRDSIRIQDPNVYRRWTLGAVHVNPRRPTP